MIRGGLLFCRVSSRKLRNEDACLSLFTMPSGKQPTLQCTRESLNMAEEARYHTATSRKSGRGAASNLETMGYDKDFSSTTSFADSVL
mmetsp:Transcript_27270/g.54985  ORF Transcript_27270/g.54985 Transcript_27270/m.54985 type:complete len:88 (+) Transcript_27270:2720-2983(+)